MSLKLFTPCCLILLLSACTPLMKNTPHGRQQVPVEQQLFLEGIGQLSQQQDPSSLRLLRQRFPASPWSGKADAVLTLLEHISQQEEQLQQLQKKLDEPADLSNIQGLEKRLKDCQAENQTLQDELTVSRQRLEALRELTIELELKEP